MCVLTCKTYVIIIIVTVRANIEKRAYVLHVKTRLLYGRYAVIILLCNLFVVINDTEYQNNSNNSNNNNNNIKILSLKIRFAVLYYRRVYDATANSIHRPSVFKRRISNPKKEQNKKKLCYNVILSLYDIVTRKILRSCYVGKRRIIVVYEILFY